MGFQELQKPKTPTQELVLQIPGCKVHLMGEGEALELAQGHFTIMRVMEQNVALATVIKVGGSFQWPLTKDEPVVKVDDLHYLFSLPVKDGGEPLSYGVTFPEQCYGIMRMLDSFLKDHCCFSWLERSNKSDLDWEDFAPRVKDYNHFLARAIAGGTGQIVKGIFMCSNAYTNQVQKIGEAILNSAAEKNNANMVRQSMNKRNDATKNSGMNENLKRVRELTNMTENLTKSLLDGVATMSGSVMTRVLKSQPGQAFLKMLPREVPLASLDSVKRVFEAAEAAEKQTFSATSKAATRMVSNRFGEEAGEATEHVLASAGHAVNTVRNVSVIRKAIIPATSSNAAGALKNFARKRKASL
ncbi:senescence/dehydration-associated protein At4g35985, chloroplastic-like isoform X2 [Vigna unguiculata]|uniref:senescence/dehydration-associated protein At4g35985, chloroplastic-like isoform X2 n=1 Tax=Vigna unguiculata TaxID=3917 RepID=UPI001015EA9B|nr:senescence/dehydration-associated protein At4g35985, chloroplastic-like isoform X2 [Vigna unguiculata]